MAPEGCRPPPRQETHQTFDVRQGCPSAITPPTVELELTPQLLYLALLRHV